MVDGLMCSEFAKFVVTICLSVCSPGTILHAAPIALRGHPGLSSAFLPVLFYTDLLVSQKGSSERSLTGSLVSAALPGRAFVSVTLVLFALQGL